MYKLVTVHANGHQFISPKCYDTLEAARAEAQEGLDQEVCTSRSAPTYSVAVVEVLETLTAPSFKDAAPRYAARSEEHGKFIEGIAKPAHASTTKPTLSAHELAEKGRTATKPAA